MDKHFRTAKVITHHIRILCQQMLPGKGVELLLFPYKSVKNVPQLLFLISSKFINKQQQPIGHPRHLHLHVKHILKTKSTDGIGLRTLWFTCPGYINGSSSCQKNHDRLEQVLAWKAYQPEEHSTMK